jgi:hypothetical protein
MKRTVIIEATVAALLLGFVGCSSSSPRTTADGTASTSSPNSRATTASGAGGPSGTFQSGQATIKTSSKNIDLKMDSGSFVKSLGAHGSVSVNWSNDQNDDVALLGDGNGGYKLSVIGSAAPNGITQNDCTAKVTKDEAAGVEGTYTCSGGISGTFEAH